jgi:lipoprotein-anchoring transpeptidase ErfK/SrfK
MLHLNHMDYKKTILIGFVAISGLFVLIPSGIRHFSKQDEINPEMIKNEYDKNATTGIFNNQIVSVPETNFGDEKVLGESETATATESDKRIEVDLTKQMTYAYEGDNLVYSFLISSGSWDRTPIGEFKIWTKVKIQKMSGGSKELGTYFYLPNVQNVMFFYNEKTAKKMGYSFHQAYWHNNFGVPMSHGCINMTTADSASLYNWADVGTKINIYGKYQTILPKI